MKKTSPTQFLCTHIENSDVGIYFKYEQPGARVGVNAAVRTYVFLLWRAGARILEKKNGSFPINPSFGPTRLYFLG